VRAVKWLLDPFAAVGVYFLLVVFVLDRPGRAPGLNVACAVVPFQLVMMTIINGLTSVRSRQSIVGNMAFPRTLIPVSSAVTESVAFVGSLFLLALMLALYGIVPGSEILWLPLAILVTIVASAALAYPASLVGLWFPELHTFVVSGVRTMFFLATGLVALDQVSGRAHDLLPLNPLTGLFEAYRSILIEGTRPAAWHLLYPLGVALAIFAVFLPIYRREQAQFAKVAES